MARKKRQQRKNRRSKIERCALERLQDPKFLFNVGQQISAGGAVVGELRNRLILFLACLTAVFDRAVSVLVKGPTSTGKNNLVKGVLSLVPPEFILTRSSFSKKAIAYGADDLTGKVLYVVEHRSGRDSQFFTRLLQSEGEVQHEVTMHFGAGTRVAKRAGAPVILSTTTDERVYEDDETRFLSLRADESPELTRQVLRAQFSEKQPKVAVKRQQDIERSEWQEVFRILHGKPPQFVYPTWFDYLSDRTPAANSRARRDAPRFLSLLEGIALCRSFSDGRREKSKNTVEINFADYCAAYRILNEALASTYAGAHPRALEFAAAVRQLYGQNQRAVTTKDVAAQLKWKEHLAHKWRIVAVRKKLVAYKPGTYASNRKPLLPGPARHATSFLPDPRLVFRKRRDVGDQVRFVDPLTGEKELLKRQSKSAKADK